MVIGYGIIKKTYVVDVLIDKFPGNNILTGTGWVKKVDKCNNGSTKISVKLNVDELLYQNIPVRYVTRVDIVNRMYSETQKI